VSEYRITDINKLIFVPIIDNHKTIFLEGYLDIVNPSIIEAMSSEENKSNRTGPSSVIIFSHGSGSSKDSTRNKRIASIFNRMGLSTLLIDLLTNEESEMDLRTQKLRHKIPGLVLNKFNIGLLTERLVTITKWLTNNESLSLKNIGYFGSSTGAAAAFLANSKLSSFDKNTVSNNKVSAIVCRGGRTDPIDDTNVLQQMTIPCLFIVGSRDNEIIKINK